MNKFPKLRIAVQKKGRLNQASMDFFASLGLRFAPNGHALVQSCEDFNIDVLLLRDDDIPEYVSRGVADLGIVGKNVLLEKQAIVEMLRELNFGKCRLVIAVPEASSIKKPDDLAGERIATTYPGILSNYLKENRIDAAVIPISGSVEITPELNLADAICDVVQTGNTLRAHNLIPLADILSSQAMLIGGPFSSKKGREFVRQFLATQP